MVGRQLGKLVRLIMTPSQATFETRTKQTGSVRVPTGSLELPITLIGWPAS